MAGKGSQLDEFKTEKFHRSRHLGQTNVEGTRAYMKRRIDAEGRLRKKGDTTGADSMRAQTEGVGNFMKIEAGNLEAKKDLDDFYRDPKGHTKRRNAKITAAEAAEALEKGR